MFLQTNESLHAAQVLAGDFKFWGSVLAAAGIFYKAYTWVKEIRTKDVPDIQSDLKKVHATLEDLGHKVDTQTSQVVSELKEMRADFRTFLLHPASPYMMPVNAKPAPRKRKNTATQKPVA